MDRPNTHDILRRYQVESDEQITYKPNFYGLGEIPIPRGQEMTKTEGAMLDNLIRERSPLELLRFEKIHNDAQNISKNRYPQAGKPPEGLEGIYISRWKQNDGHMDAFRHAYWNARLTKEYGEPWAKAFATAHEGGPKNPFAREAMDLYNNEVGRKIAVDNPTATKEQLADLVEIAVYRGDLLVLDRVGQLSWSDQVAIGEHGMARAVPARPSIKTPENTDEKVEPHRMDNSSSLNSPTNKLHDVLNEPRIAALYAGCSHGVDALDARLGRTADQASDCMKASLTQLAANNGLERVDHVMLSDSGKNVGAGENVFVVQGDPQNPAHLRAHMPTDQATATPVEASLRALSQTEHAPSKPTHDVSQPQETQHRGAHTQSV